MFFKYSNARENPGVVSPFYCTLILSQVYDFYEINLLSCIKVFTVKYMYTYFLRE